MHNADVVRKPSHKLEIEAKGELRNAIYSIKFYLKYNLVVSWIEDAN